MARTIKGNLTGQAAATELADQRQWLLDSADQQIARTVQEAKNRFGDLQTELTELMGEEEFSAWYDDDDNIPARLQWSRMEPIFAKMQQVIDGLKKAGRSAAPERPASNEPGQSDKAGCTTDPIDCITESGGES